MAEPPPQEDVAVPVSARTGVPLHRTVRAYLESDDDAKVEIGMLYVRRIFALLVLQFTAIGMILSPFCLIDSVQRWIQSPYVMIPLNVASFVGLFGSVYVVAAHGDEPWAARVGLLGGTFCFAVALGAKLALAPAWSNCALVAIGQATANFALLHAFYQFLGDRQTVQRMIQVYGGTLLCLAVAGLWLLLMREAGCPWRVAASVPLAGWLFAIHILLAARKSAGHREPNDYLRAAIFILGPPVPRCLLLNNNKRRQRGCCGALCGGAAAADSQEEEEEEGLTTSSSTKDYGAVVDSKV